MVSSLLWVDFNIFYRLSKNLQFTGNILILCEIKKNCHVGHLFILYKKSKLYN